MSRTRKRSYTKSKRFDRSCRNHGTCRWCERNRLCAAHRRENAADDQLDDFYHDSPAD